jgi:hypothetical protein
MPCFFFHVYDEVVARDDEGHACADLQAAIAEAVRGVRSLACEQVHRGVLHLRHRIEIADEADHVLAIVTFKDVIEIRA